MHACIEENNIKRIYKLTSRTLISGNPKAPNLIDALWNKVILIYDLAEVLTRHIDEKAAIFSQLQLYKTLKYLDQNYDDKRALEIIERIVDSTGDQNMQKVYKFLEDRFPLLATTNEVAEGLRLGYKTVYSKLNILWALDVVEMEKVEYKTENGEGNQGKNEEKKQTRKFRTWSLKKRF